MRFSHDLTRNLPVSGTNLQSNLNHNSSRRATSGNCTNNLTAPDSLRFIFHSFFSHLQDLIVVISFIFRHPAPALSAEPTESEPPTDETADVGESHQPIATFDEWTKEKLKQEHRKVVVS